MFVDFLDLEDDVDVTDEVLDTGTWFFKGEGVVVECNECELKFDGDTIFDGNDCGDDVGKDLRGTDICDDEFIEDSPLPKQISCRLSSSDTLGSFGSSLVAKVMI